MARKEIRFTLEGTALNALEEYCKLYGVTNGVGSKALTTEMLEHKGYTKEQG